jgi:hypothetical protein
VNGTESIAENAVNNPGCPVRVFDSHLEDDRQNTCFKETEVKFLFGSLSVSLGGLLWRGRTFASRN